MNITGTMINYYFHCKRQCWLFSNRINLEDNSEDVRIGRVLHEVKFKDKSDSEIKIENIRVDKISGEYLIELKKSDADEEATRWQTLFYLKKLYDKGIDKKGKIEYVEKNKKGKKVVEIELSEELKTDLDKLLDEMEELLLSPDPPEAKPQQKCKRCAYYEYCFI